MFYTSLVASRTDSDFFSGWDMGRTLCLTRGPEAAHQWLREHPRDPEAYRRGVAQALRDYLDSNGLPQPDPLGTA